MIDKVDRMWLNYPRSVVNAGARSLEDIQELGTLGGLANAEDPMQNGKMDLVLGGSDVERPSIDAND